MDIETPSKIEKLLGPSKSLENLRLYDSGEAVDLNRREMFILDVMTRPETDCVFGRLIEKVVRLRGEDGTFTRDVEETRREPDGIYLLPQASLSS